MIGLVFRQAVEKALLRRARIVQRLGSAGGYFPFAKSHYIGERPHEVRSVPPRAFTRCGLAWDKARPWAKRLSWQTQGGRVK